MPVSSTFTIQFSKQSSALAVRVPIKSDANEIVTTLGLAKPRPVIFISGGAGNMTDHDVALTSVVVNDAIASFAQSRNITVIDGGTDAGVMRMIGEVRRNRGFTFPLIGIAPHRIVTYPSKNRTRYEAELQDGHSHFVLIDSASWGKESQTIVDLTRTIAADTYPMLGILINGGKIAEQDIFLATSKGEHSIPILVLEGSGRKADEVSDAVKTGTTSSRIIKAIIAGGKIDLVGLGGGAQAMLDKLNGHFGAVNQ